MEQDMQHVVGLNFFDFCFTVQDKIREGYVFTEESGLCPQQMGYIFSATLVKDVGEKPAAIASLPTPDAPATARTKRAYTKTN